MCKPVAPPTVLYPELFAKPHNLCEVVENEKVTIGTGEIGVPGEKSLKEKNGGKRHFVNEYNRNKEYFKTTLDRNVTLSCTVGYIKGGCESGHRFLKSIYCGKEWCGNCGLEGSPTHERRIARWFPKVITFKSLGYFVITIPSCIRDRFNNRAQLSAFRTYCKRKLQRMGFDKGLSRWHIFGECERCAGDGCNTCNNTGAGTTYNPHLNFFVESGFLNKKILDELRNDLTRYFRNHNRDVSPEKLKGNAHFIYTIEMPLIVHKLKYVTRATFRVLDDRTREYESTWKGYRITSTWGKFEKPEKENTSELVALENGNCPHCLQVEQVNKLSWNAGHYVEKVDESTGEIKQVFKRTLVSRKDIHEAGTKLQHIEAGYYFIVDD